MQRLQDCPDVQISTGDTGGLEPGESAPQKLIDLARILGARLLTANENLNRMARLQKVETLSVFELDEALKPTVNVGDRLRLVLVRGGKEDHQGVGYLPDGTMIVVNNAAPKIGQAVVVTVISTLQTNAGTMVFAELQPAS
ncbi:MAG: TRAM domain-containing protein [Akkermansiaceae bacterium]|nr:TRAM domain-containing protein [Akkermansiaceae bacterium]